MQIALTVATAWPTSAKWTEQAALTAWVKRALAPTRRAFESCNIELDVVRAELAAVPSRLLTVVANGKNSWAGLAPEGEDPAAFNYDLGEKLTPEVTELFNFARRDLPNGTIGVVVIDRIDYYAAKKATVAGGLSFPPVVYHATEDFPARNGVLVATAYPKCGSLPSRLNDRVIAHELGHMLLDQPSHDTDPKNLMNPQMGGELREEQCLRMRKNLRGIFGKNAFADPGRPGSK